MPTAFFYALAICVVAAALEGVFAGSGVKQRLAQVHVPRFALPLRGWILVAIFYYVICFVVFFRLFSLPESTSLRDAAVVLLGAIMFVNGLWNYFFFRSRNLFHAFLIGLPYALAAIVLFILLLRIDRTAAWWLLPYLLYLPYATTLGYRMWKLNRPAS